MSCFSNYHGKLSDIFLTGETLSNKWILVGRNNGVEKLMGNWFSIWHSTHETKILLYEVIKKIKLKWIIQENEIIIDGLIWGYSFEFKFTDISPRIKYSNPGPPNCLIYTPYTKKNPEHYVLHIASIINFYLEICSSICNLKIINKSLN